jgi:hypothetical protein
VQNSQSGLLSWFVYRIKSMTMSPVSVSSLLMTVMSLEFFVHPPLYLEHTVLLCNWRSIFVWISHLVEESLIKIR